MNDRILTIEEYLACVDMLVDGYFDVDGEYQPHWGELNAMKLYYNFVYNKNNPTDSIVGDTMKTMLIDDKFIRAFHDEITDTQEILQLNDEGNPAGVLTLPKNDVEALSFRNAYSKSMDIVNTRKSSIGNAISVITGAIKNLSDGINDVMTEENLKSLSVIAKDIKSGKIGADSIVESYLSHKDT